MEQSGMWILRGITIVAAACLLIQTHHAQKPESLPLGSARQEMRRTFYSEDEEHGPLFPVIFNLAAHARITANATCGLDRPDVYCKLVEHVLMKPPQCGICDAHSEDPAKRHAAENAIDGSPRWWQSPSIATGHQYEYITIVIDMLQHYQVAYIHNQGGQFTATRSLGVNPARWTAWTYSPWQYFARTEEECLDLFGVTGTMGRTKFTSDDQIVCSTDYSRIHPLEDGEIHASLINDRPGVDGPSQALIDWTTARYVRLRFVKIHTLTADLIPGMPTAGIFDASETRRYFYSIKDISIGGQCICFGHARDCPTDKEGIARCQCAHNTCGESCERCCPLFNQKPWLPGTAALPSACEGCQCHGHADECRYDAEVARSRLSVSITGKYDGGGVCVACQHNTTGINCERCVDGFFRPLGVDRFNPIGCLLCECQDFGTTGQCIADEESMMGELQPGDCVCLEGFGGPKCDHCAPGYRNYPDCEPCPCNYAGSKNGEACEGDCECKDNVEGARCEVCREGYFNLDAGNPQGCTACFCFGVTDQCESVGWNISKVTTLDEWILTDSTGSRILYPSYLNGTPVVAADDTYEMDVFYWLAPKPFRGNRLTSYGGKLDYSITFIKGRGDLTGSYTADVDVILEGNGVRVGKGERFFRESTPHHSSVSLQEHGWHHVSLNGIFGEYASKEQFMTLLENVEKVMIRGTYHTRQLESRLLHVAMSLADPDARDTGRLASVERCTACPQGYDGLSCEACTSGHRRVNQTLYNGICVPCHCYAHATTCDAYDGECRDCQHNTAGFFCDQCAAGYYGDAKSGDPSACKPCGCPLMIATNNFSPTCVAGNAIGRNEDYVCTGCPVGYHGAKCEMCSDGYFGNPMLPGNFCQPCMCSGNADLAAVGNCERLTGKCLKCVGNTEGFSCDKCKKGYFGNALKHDCQACECSQFGAEHADCHRQNGQCVCKPGYEGKKCDRCAAGFGQISEGCLPCDCDSVGAVSRECDPTSGQCQCLEGVFGLHCRRCQEGYFGFSADGCQSCNCEPIGSVNQTCDPVTGQCFCKARVAERTCNRCEPLFWGITSGKGCEACNCDATGAMSALCDPIAGHCKCRPSVTGRTCSECEVGFYGLTSRGCTKCPVCRIAGQVCDRHTGECICPPLTVGERCDKCAPNSHAYHPLLGCKACNCSAIGASGLGCDVVTGQCACRPSYTNARCDQCHFGFYGFPECKACACDLNGTSLESCREGKCICDQTTGHCTCRTNVEGRQCNRCKARTFSLDHHNPDGCTGCFCSGKSNRCYQAPYIWRVLGHTGNRVDVTYITPQHGRPVANSLNRSLAMDTLSFGVDRVTLPRKHYETPFYWNLPVQFLGDRILSYNGKLTFQLDADYGQQEGHHRGRGMAAFPLALLQGNSRIILDYKPHRSHTHGIHEIHFHESQWHNRQSPQVPVSRDLLMVALQQVQHILIRANSQPMPSRLEISQIGLEHAGRSAERGLPGTPRPAFGVELCECPVGYNGSSCQNAANGYYRKHLADALDHIDHLKLLGESILCDCHNHSKECDVETGRCENCQHHTDGDRCQRCEKGYYGDAEKGTRTDCHRCACPTVEASFSETCTSVRSHDGTTDFTCDTCRHGFVGLKCESCERGYYGNPRRGVPCVSCHCNAWGSMSSLCHPLTGECPCRPGLQGRDCSKCQPGHVVTAAGCINCMHDKCIKTLMDEFGELERGLELVNTSGMSQAPLKRLTRLQERYDHVSVVVSGAIGESNSVMDSIFPSMEAGFDFDREIRRVMLSANKTATDAIALKEAGMAAQSTVTTICRDVPLIEQKIRQLSDDLRAYVQSEASQGSLNVQLILTEAEAVLGDIENKAALFSNTSGVGELSSILAVLSEIESLDSADSGVASTLWTQFEKFRKRMTEMQQYIENDIGMALRSATPSTGESVDKLEALQANIELMKETAANTTAMLERSHGLMLNATKDQKNATRAFEEAQMTLKGFKDALTNLQQESGILEDLNPRYREEHFLPALEHSLQLTEKADMLAELFDAAKSEAKDPMTAARVYDKIVEQVNEAKNTTIALNKTIDEVFLILYPTNEPELSVRASEALSKSTELDDAAKALLETDIVELHDSLEAETGRLDGVNATNLRTGLELDAIADRVELLPMDLMDRILNVEEAITNVSRQASEALVNVNKISQAVNTDLKPKFNQIKDVDKNTVDQALRLVQESRRDVGNLDRSVADLESTTKSLEDLHRNMSKKIQSLRDVILKAKQAASTLQISLSPDSRGVCRRSYEPSIIPSSANTITLTYSTSAPERNSLLMYIGNPRSYALVKNTAQLLVVQMAESEILGDPVYINGSSDPGYTRMDLNRSSEMFVGGLPNSVDIPEIQSKGFFGCLGQVAIDGQQIGLWNYKTSDGCAGCAAGVAESGDGTSFRFNGNGFASAPQIKRYNNKRYTISLSFRTFDENALLFLCANDKMPAGDFISLELRDGKVAFQFYLGGQNHLLVMTNRRFNSGSLVNVRAERSEFFADLRVADDHIKASLPPNGPDGLELAGSEMYFGGVPPGHPFKSHYNITYKPFIGCLKDIQVDVTAIDLLAKTVYRTNVEQGCKKRAIRDVSFSNSNGYLRLPGRTLPQNASISFSFATGQADGLLIASISNDYKKDQNYWTASLQGGRLVLVFNAGSVATKIQVDKYYDDRILHIVSLQKRRKRIDVRVDDIEVQEEKLATSSGPITSDVMYIGGAPSDIDLSAIAASARSFVGCFTGLVINGVLVGFEQLQAFDKAAVGRCEFEAPAPILEPTSSAELLPQAMALSRGARSCLPFPKLQKTPLGWNAVSFAGTEESRVEIFPPRRDTKVFNLTMVFRTVVGDGTLFYTENPIGEEVLMVSLRGGKLVLTVIDELPQEIFSTALLADGEWHILRLERKARRASFQIDDSLEDYLKLTRKFVTSLPFYMAGVGSAVKLPAGMVRAGFRGCLANVTLNERNVNLLAENSVQGVGTCHLNVDPAVYFQGSGYAVQSEHFKPNGKIQVEMELRTNSLSGELLLLYDPVKRSYVQLKFNDGHLVFNISTGVESFHVTKLLTTKHGLCDGLWHRVKALYAQHVLMVTVDDAQVEVAYAAETALELPDNVALYVAGRPASVPAQFVPKVPNFAGCIRNMVVNGVAVDFQSVFALHNALLDSCPRAG